MPCDLSLRAGQTNQQRAAEVRQQVSRLDRLLMLRKVRVVVGPQGAVTFQNWEGADRVGITDACAYRRLMVSGSVPARVEIARAEQVAGRAVDKRVVAAGVHSHDGGQTWHSKG